jgi:hypothetical protein
MTVGRKILGRFKKLGRLAKISQLIGLYFEAGPQLREIAVGGLNFGAFRINNFRVNAPQPSVFPINPAAVLAAVMTAAVAARAIQNHHVVRRKTPHRMALDARLVDPALYAK